MKLTCAAILFDMDGVLVDSGPLAERHWRRWAELHDVPFERIAAVHHGRPSIETVRLVAPHLDSAIEGPKREAAEAADTDGLIAFEGAKELLCTIPPDRWAVVTSSQRATAIKRLTHVGLPLPKILVTAEDVTHGKPSPEPYQRAAQLLGFTSARCIVVEDAPSGIESGKSAGSRVIAIGSRSNKLADLTISRLANIAFTHFSSDVMELSVTEL